MVMGSSAISLLNRSRCCSSDRAPAEMGVLSLCQVVKVLKMLVFSPGGKFKKTIEFLI